MRYALADDCFLLGEHVIRRKLGHTMCGSFSEPATLNDLGHDTMHLDNDVDKQKRLGWYVPGVPFRKLIQACQHVDDSLVMSRIRCATCPFRGNQLL